VLSQGEVAALLNSIQNKKHKAMLMLAYSGGLRVSEVVALKTRDVDPGRMCIFLERAKGKKDRLVPLSPVLLVMLRDYARAYRPDR
jgi:integrase